MQTTRYIIHRIYTLSFYFLVIGLVLQTACQTSVPSMELVYI